MLKPIQIKTLSHCHLWVRFSDGVEGTVDLSHLSGKGVFASWKKQGFFEKAFIHPETGAIAWDENLEICPDSLYLQITGKKFETFSPSHQFSSHA